MKIPTELRAFQRSPNMYETVVGRLLATAPATGTFIDGGAHLGDHTANMLSNEHVNSVFAIEAIPRLCDRLTKRFHAEPRARIVESAIGRSVGAATFHVAEDAPGYSGLKSRTIEAVTKWAEIPVKVMPLDELIPADEHQSVKVIKLDLEGGEFDGMRGATEIIVSASPMIIFENGLRNSAQVY